MVEKLVSEINDALSHNLYFAALNLALTLPDICGKAEYPNLGTTKRYKLWYDEYIGKYEKAPTLVGETEMPYLNGEIIYNLRCSLLHEGNANIDKEKYKKKNKEKCPIDHFLLVIQSEQPFHIYGGETSSVYTASKGNGIREYQVNVRRLCMIICLCAEAYYYDNKDKFKFFNYKIIDWDTITAGLPKISLEDY